jgi:hypothetical protein
MARVFGDRQLLLPSLLNAAVTCLSPVMLCRPPSAALVGDTNTRRVGVGCRYGHSGNMYASGLHLHPALGVPGALDSNHEEGG